jgi:hypothetical protein
MVGCVTLHSQGGGPISFASCDTARGLLPYLCGSYKCVMISCLDSWPDKVSFFLKLILRPQHSAAHNYHMKQTRISAVSLREGTPNAGTRLGSFPNP